MSKGLEALEKLRYFDEHTLTKDNKFRIMGELDIIEKELEALEIIKEKRVNIDYLRSCKSLEDYNNILIEKWQLTQEEYNLLKEVLP